MAYDYEYHGDYPGLVDGKWLVDLRDGHLYIDSPKGVSLGNFPGWITLHFMRSRKEFVANAVDLTNAIFAATISTNTFIEHNLPGAGHPYYETRVGAVGKELSIPSTVPVDQQILSIVLTDGNNNAFGIINLRHYITIPVERKLKISLTNALRYTMETAKLVKHDDPGSLLNSFVSADYRCFMVQAPANMPTNGTWFTPAQWQTFITVNASETKWPETIAAAPSSSQYNTIIGDVTTAFNAKPIVTLKGKLPDSVDTASIKALFLPFCDRVGVVILFNEVKLVDNTIKRTALNIFKGQNFEFAFEIDYIGAAK